MDDLTQGKLIATVDGLSRTVHKLTEAVERLDRKQSYWTGALAAIGVVCSGIGALASFVIQWFHK